MSNQVQRPRVYVPYDPDAIFYPNGTHFVPEGNRVIAPYRPAPCYPNRQDSGGMHAQETYLSSRAPSARSPAPASAPMYATNDNIFSLRPAQVHRGQLDYVAGMSLLETALRNSNQGRVSSIQGRAASNQSGAASKQGPSSSTQGLASLTTANLAIAQLHQQIYGTTLPTVNQARVRSNQQTSRLPLPPGLPFNPAAPIFRSVLQPNREAEYRNKSENLVKTLDEQTAVIVAVQDALYDTASNLFCAIKDMKAVVRSLQQGQSNDATNIKKLEYRATDLEAVLERQEICRRRLAELSMPNVSRA
ncbi:hypothetical protein MMC26_005845 [Xylographa opegraphella]|nr:hypothetical protein [Xylographa opegraphella]